MAIALVMEFPGIGQDKYDAVMKELGLDEPGATWPEGSISHTAGTIAGGWCVVDVWESQAAWDKFLANELGPAIEKVGGIPQPQPKTAEVYNMHQEGVRQAL